MSPLFIGIIAIAALIILLLLQVPIAVALITVGVIGFWITAELDIGLNVLGTLCFTSLAKYVLATIPLFILMGHFAEAGGYVEEFFNTARKWFGAIPGALSMATMVTCAFLGAVSGSSLASAALMGRVATPAMLKAGYSKAVSSGSVVLGGTLSGMIPPSIIMVFYGIITEQSIGQLLIAGIAPGVMTAIVWIITTYILTRMIPDWFPPAERGVTFREKVTSTKTVWPMLLLILLVLGGLYAGLFTPSQAGAVGVLGTIILLPVKKRFSTHVLGEGLRGVVQITGSIFLIIIGAFTFGVFLAYCGFSKALTDFFVNLPLPGYLLIAGFMLLYVILGCFMGALEMMAVTIPPLLPVILALGYDPIWWGVMVVKGVEIGLATPPFAMNVFILKSVVPPEVELKDIYKGCIPFLIAEIPILALLIAFPHIALFLPQTMMRR